MPLKQWMSVIVPIVGSGILLNKKINIRSKATQLLSRAIDGTNNSGEDDITPEEEIFFAEEEKRVDALRKHYSNLNLTLVDLSNEIDNLKNIYDEGKSLAVYANHNFFAQSTEPDGEVIEVDPTDYATYEDFCDFITEQIHHSRLFSGGKGKIEHVQGNIVATSKYKNERHRQRVLTNAKRNN
jgi:hypothetical protein